MASERLGASFSIDVTDLKAGLTQANRLIRESESEFKAAAAGLDDWSKSEDGINARIKSLNEITDVQKKKVAALKQEYQNLVNNGMDPASREAIELRTRINREEAALNSNEKELKEQTAALKEVKNGANDAGQSFTNFGNIAKTAGKIAATAFASAAAAVGALLKTSIENFAEYEQLVGGVETLFGAGGQSLEEYAASVGKSVDAAKDEYNRLMDAQNAMIANANDAYKTAGMSANDYISNVTGFSAALISSLDGDTVAAAAAADRAMRDISDNANKMGTDMQSIVDTYQSLAKGNFQMLDNLKLGYGGTKTEMERLIADAAKMTDIQGELNVTVQEGDMSFANMVNAISVIQAQMGIMGTTEREAASTIQGSLGMMSAAWQNLTTGIADETANIDQLISNFIDSIGAVAENLLPRITVAVDGIIQMVEGLLPQLPPLLEQFLPVIIDGIMNLLAGVVEVLPTIIDTILDVIPQLLTAIIEMLPTILTTLVQLVVQVINALTEMLPTIITAIMEILPMLINALVEAIPQLIMAAIQFLMAIVDAIPVIVTSLVENLPMIINTIITTLLDALPLLIDAAVQLLMALIHAIPEISIALVENLPMIITTIITALIQAIPAIIEAAIQLFGGLISGIADFLPQLWNKMPEVIDTVVSGISDGFSAIVEIGGNIVSGIWEGIKGAGDWLWEQVSGFFGGIVDGIAGFLGIHSPSTLMENLIGKNMALGVGVGFEDEMKKVNKQINNAIQIDDVGVNATVSGSMASENNANGKSVVVYQTNNYAQAHSRYELYKSKQQTLAAVQLAMAGA